MTTVVVAICTNRAPADVRRCLAALVAEAPARLLLVTSGLDAAAVAAHERAVGHVIAARLAPCSTAAGEGHMSATEPSITVIGEPEPGLSRARNRALAACRDDEVIAFVDDDATVAPGWLAHLGVAWDAAEPDVACIGGRILPRFIAPRPAWLTDRLLGVLTVLDLGDELRDLDPTITTVYGANISFRCGALRRIGGFDPAYGHIGDRLWFSDEDEAQRALARAGLRVRYAPHVAVAHEMTPERLTPRALLRRRFRYGASLGKRGARPTGTALRQLIRSALGAPLAAARGERSLALERAVRAAENAGVLVAPLARR